MRKADLPENHGCAERLFIINGAIAGLAGPGQRTAIIVPCTVIRAGDVADQLLDRQKHPDWHGERTKMVYAFPTADRLWSAYARIRAESLRAGGNGHEATEFYRANREAMDAGAQVAGPEGGAEHRRPPTPANSSSPSPNRPPDKVWGNSWRF
jgi:hypothetical protein